MIADVLLNQFIIIIFERLLFDEVEQSAVNEFRFF
jgi:hypothetical protein